MSRLSPILAGLTGFGLLLSWGCTHHFVPASAANRIPGEEHTARAAASGVTMEVKVDSWSGDPANLTSVLTPVKLDVSNEGPHPVSLRYRDFLISNPNGVRSAALPPFRIHGSVAEPVTPAMAPDFAFNNFYVYPSYGFYGPAIGLWPDNWGWDGGWYGTYYGYWQQNLPTSSMLRKAIPEGVLNAGGRLSGYLYFQKVPSDAQSLEFVANLIDAKTHNQFGTIRIPFERQHT